MQQLAGLPGGKNALTVAKRHLSLGGQRHQAGRVPRPAPRQLHAEWFSQNDHPTLARRLRDVDLATTVSDHITQKTRRDFPMIADHVVTAYNGIDTAELNRERDYRATTQREDKRILYAGAVSPHKGIHVLLDAFKIVVQSYPHVCLDIVGPQRAIALSETFDRSGSSFGVTVILGRVGHPGKRQITVIGDTVNMASRIESMTKELGVPLLVSDSVVAHLPGGLRLGPPTEALLKGRAGSTLQRGNLNLNKGVICEMSV